MPTKLQQKENLLLTKLGKTGSNKANKKISHFIFHSDLINCVNGDYNIDHIDQQPSISGKHSNLAVDVT